MKIFLLFFVGIRVNYRLCVVDFNAKNREKAKFLIPKYLIIGTRSTSKYFSIVPEAFLLERVHENQ